MAIAIEFKDNIQLVRIEGKITKPEEAALRLKLDQKFSQGRALFILKLEKFEFSDADSLTAILDLIKYLGSLGAWMGLAGLNAKQSGMFQAQYSGRCKSFATEQEAKKWIIEESQKPKEASKGHNVSEDEIKRTEINNLIQSYANSFVEKDPDPFRISKLGFEYLATPSADFFHAIRQLLLEKQKIETEIQKYEGELGQLEKELLDLMIFRKLPTTEAEIQSHTKLAETKVAENDKVLQELNTQINSKHERMAAIKKEIDDHHARWKTKIETLETDLKNLKSKHENISQEFAKREKQETEMLEKLRQGAS